MMDTRRRIKEAERSQHSGRAVGEVDPADAGGLRRQNETVSSPRCGDHAGAHAGRARTRVRLVDQRGDVVQRVGQGNLNRPTAHEEFSREVEGYRAVRVGQATDLLVSREL